MSAQTRPKVDLSGMPQPTSREETEQLVAILLNSLAEEDDQAVVLSMAVIRTIAGPEYTGELVKRVNAVYRAVGV